MKTFKNSFTSMKGEGGGDFQGDGGVDLYDDVITAPSSNDAPPSTDNRQVEVCNIMNNTNLCNTDLGC